MRPWFPLPSRSTWRRCKEILGPDGIDLVVSDDPVLDKNQAAAFAAQARVKTEVVRDPKQPGVATMITGAEDWPSPIPLSRKAANGGSIPRRDVRRSSTGASGENELNAIQMCRGYVEAQHEYAAQKHDGSAGESIRPARHQHSGTARRLGVADAGWNLAGTRGRDASRR